MTIMPRLSRLLDPEYGEGKSKDAGIYVPSKYDKNKTIRIATFAENVLKLKPWYWQKIWSYLIDPDSWNKVKDVVEWVELTKPTTPNIIFRDITGDDARRIGHWYTVSGDRGISVSQAWAISANCWQK